MLDSAEGNRIITRMIGEGFDVDTRIRRGETGLMEAAENRDIDKVRILLNAGADVNIQNNKGDTALQFAARNVHIQIVVLLLAGANPMLQGDTNHLWFFYARRGDINGMQNMVTSGFNVNARDEEGYTALMEASYFGHLQLVKKLIEDWHADVTIKDNYFNRNALMQAARLKRNQIINFLLNIPAVQQQINDQDGRGYTALMYYVQLYAEAAYLPVVRIFLDKGADLNITNERGETAGDLAADPRVKQFLRENLMQVIPGMQYIMPRLFPTIEELEQYLPAIWYQEGPIGPIGEPGV